MENRQTKKQKHQSTLKKDSYAKKTPNFFQSIMINKKNATTMNFGQGESKKNFEKNRNQKGKKIEKKKKNQFFDFFYLHTSPQNFATIFHKRTFLNFF